MTAETRNIPVNLPFMIFTPERTGSTTLARLMSRHPGIVCEPEPFNPGYTGPVPFLCRTLLESQGIAAAVQSLWSYSLRNGFKHVRKADGWPFVGRPELNDWLLQHATASVIMLTRRNGLQRAISGQISTQMGIWVYVNEAEHRKVREHRFMPLDIEALRQEVAHERREFERTCELVAATGKPWRRAYYEDFFGPGLALEARLAAVQSLLEFIGVGPVTDAGRLESMRWLLDPGNTGFQNAEGYERIPNIREVERELGSAENGFVLER